jgi:hypothetical protein
MRTILLVLCILSVTLTASAQFRDWAEGSYYDTLGHKRTGLIAWHAPDKLSRKPGDHLFFKSNKKADKLRVESFGIRAFTMGKDSFVVSNDKSIDYAPVLQVLINRPTKLYYWSAKVTSLPLAILGGAGAAVAGATVITSTSGGVAYLYGTDADHLNVLTRKNFIDVMCEIMADRTEITQKIKNKELIFGDIHDLLVYYNTGILPKKSRDDIY